MKMKLGVQIKYYFVLFGTEYEEKTKKKFRKYEKKNIFPVPNIFHVKFKAITPLKNVFLKYRYQDGITCHTVVAIINLLKSKFGYNFVSRNDSVLFNYKIGFFNIS